MTEKYEVHLLYAGIQALPQEKLIPQMELKRVTKNKTCAQKGVDDPDEVDDPDKDVSETKYRQTTQTGKWLVQNELQ